MRRSTLSESLNPLSLRFGNVLAYPRCAGEMKVIASIEPPQVDGIENILWHFDLWYASAPAMNQ
jgi:hypothetical protein